jgi:hypothetical protein
MLYRPSTKATAEYYCWVGILLASLAVMMVSICDGMGILNLKQDTVHAAGVFFVPRSAAANPSTIRKTKSRQHQCKVNLVWQLIPHLFPESIGHSGMPCERDRDSSPVQG